MVAYMIIFMQITERYIDGFVYECKKQTQRCGMKYQCLNPAAIVEKAQQGAERSDLYSCYSNSLVTSFVSLLNSLFALTSCTQTQEQQAIGGIDKVGHHSGVTIND